MKKFAGKRIFSRWCAAAVVVLIALMALMPSAYAAYPDYVNGAGISGLNGNTNAKNDMDSLFIYMMNQAMPIGYIYITQDPTLNTAAAMAIKYGGTWQVWGQGRAPAGVNNDNVAGVLGGPNNGTYPANPANVNQKGGYLNDATPSNATITPVSPATSILSATGNVILTRGSLTKSTNGRFVWNNNNNSNGNPSTMAGSQTGYYTVSGSQTFTSTGLICQWPNHTHGAEKPGFGTGQRQPGDGSGRNFFYSTAPNDNRSFTSTSVGGGTTFSVGTVFNLAWWTAYFNPPSINYTDPTINYTPQQFSHASATAVDDGAGFGAWGKNRLPVSALTLALNSGSGRASWTNETIQPYETVYMYRRTGLANIKPLS